MHNLHIFGIERHQCCTEITEVALEEYVDWQLTIGLVPPDLATLQESHLVLWQHQPTIIIEADHVDVLVLYYAHILQVALSYKA